MWFTGMLHDAGKDARSFDCSPDLLGAVGFDGLLKEINTCWEGIFGFAVEDLKGRSFWDLVHPEDRAKTILEAQKLVVGKEAVSWENRFRCQDGSYKRILWIPTASFQRQLIYLAGREIPASLGGEGGGPSPEAG